MVSKPSEVKPNVYFVVDMNGIKFANGGYVNLTSWHWLLKQRGHKVRFLDVEVKGMETSKLTDLCPSAEYLCEDIHICGPDAFDADESPKLLWIAWMSEQFYEVAERRGWGGLILFYDLGQLLRAAHMAKVEMVRRLSPFPIFIGNGFLKPIYTDMGIPDAIPLDAFNRDDFFYDNFRERKSGLIGYQPEGYIGTEEKQYSRDITQTVEQSVDNLLLCTGMHREVGEKIRQCDIFLWFNMAAINRNLLEGECIGRSLIEALSSGCIVIAKMNYFTLRMMPQECLVCTLEEGLWLMNRLLANPRKKEQLRQKCLERGRDYHFAGFGGKRQKVLDWIFGQVVEKL